MPRRHWAHTRRRSAQGRCSRRMHHTRCPTPCTCLPPLPALSTNPPLVLPSLPPNSKSAPLPVSLLCPPCLPQRRTRRRRASSGWCCSPPAPQTGLSSAASGQQVRLRLVFSLGNALSLHAREHSSSLTPPFVLAPHPTHHHHRRGPPQPAAARRAAAAHRPSPQLAALQQAAGRRRVTRAGFRGSARRADHCTAHALLLLLAGRRNVPPLVCHGMCAAVALPPC